MSNGASLAPQEIRIDFAVLPETKCQGLFNHLKECFRILLIFTTILWIAKISTYTTKDEIANILQESM